MELPKEIIKAYKAAQRDNRTYDVCAYIYRDGIAFWFRNVPINFHGNKQAGKTSVWYTYKTPIRITNFAKDRKFNGRIVIHEASLLLDGINEVDISDNTMSETMKTQGIPSGQYCTITTMRGMRISLYDFPFLSGSLKIQWENVDSIENVIEEVKYNPNEQWIECEVKE